MSGDLPGWAGRQLLAEALRAVGLPVVAGAMWRRPMDAMTLGQRLQAVALYGRVLTEARRRLPAGVSGASLDRGWRDAAWRCTVAALVLLDAEARDRLVGRGTDMPERRPVRAELPAAKPAAPLLIRRRGDVARAS